MTADLIIAATLLASGLLAMMRGFTLELLSIAAFALAALAALLLLPFVRPLLDHLFPAPWMTLTASLCLIFFVALIPLWYAGDTLAQKVRKSKVGVIDRTAGFAFGLVRGLFVLAIAYLIVDGFTGTGDARPGWLDDRHAVLMPVVRDTSELLLKVAPDVARDARRDVRKLGSADLPRFTSGVAGIT